MQKITTILFVLICAANLAAQKRTGAQIIRGGLVKVGLHTGPGFYVTPSLVSMNIGGELEVYLSKRVSIRSDISFYLPTIQSQKVIAHNHSLFWGLNLHMPYKKLDFFIGLQPGLSIVQSYDDINNLTFVQGIPVISALAGCQLYFSRFFHCYLATRFITGQYFRNASTPLNMTEFRVTVGMGFNINVIRLKEGKKY